MPKVFCSRTLLKVAKNKQLLLSTSLISSKLSCLQKHYAALAQLVEHLTVNQVVAGSSPAGGV